MKKIHLAISMSLLFQISCATDSPHNAIEYCSQGDEAICPEPTACGDSSICGDVIVGAEYTEDGELCSEDDYQTRVAIFEEVAANYALEIDQMYNCINAAVFIVPDGQENYWIEILSQDERLDSAELNWIEEIMELDAE